MPDAPPTPPFALPPGYDAVAEAKRLLRTIRAGSLATVSSDGAPFASLVTVATLPDGSPILLLSGLSSHTQHLAGEGRCALLLSRGGKGDPLAHPRLTLTGTARRLDGAELIATARSRFLRRQPKAALYADFPDFGFFVLSIAAAHLNGGFAKAARLGPDEILTPTAEAAALIESEEGAVTHMNADHREALALYATRLCGAAEGDWTASGIDPEGIDLVCGDRVARLAFDDPITSSQALRRVLKDYADRARVAGLEGQAEGRQP